MLIRRVKMFVMKKERAFVERREQDDIDMLCISYSQIEKNRRKVARTVRMVVGVVYILSRQSR